MKKQINFPSIEQFRNVVANVNRNFNFVGLDENGEAIYDHTKIKPTLTFKGTVKLHGTNAGISFNATDGLWAQSRENIITPERDNAGFAFFVHSQIAEFMDLMQSIQNKENINTIKNTITIYGEWCGGNIQKGVGITNLPKSFFIFGVKISPIIDIEDLEAIKANPAYWVDSSYLKFNEIRVYNISDYPTWEMEINFNEPEMVQNKLSDLTIAVEEECPVAKVFGFSGIGEGIVWACDYQGVVHRFKTKGDKHSNSKVTTLKPVDDVKINKIITIVNQITPAWRMEQMLDKTFNLMNGGTMDIKRLGDYIRAVISDIIKEEMIVLQENNIEPKDIGKYVSNISRKYFLQRFNEGLGL